MEMGARDSRRCLRCPIDPMDGLVGRPDALQNVGPFCVAGGTVSVDDLVVILLRMVVKIEIWQCGIHHRRRRRISSGISNFPSMIFR